MNNGYLKKIKFELRISKKKRFENFFVKNSNF